MSSPKNIFQLQNSDLATPDARKLKVKVHGHNMGGQTDDC